MAVLICGMCLALLGSFLLGRLVFVWLMAQATVHGEKAAPTVALVSAMLLAVFAAALGLLVGSFVSWKIASQIGRQGGSFGSWIKMLVGNRRRVSGPTRIPSSVTSAGYAGQAKTAMPLGDVDVNWEVGFSYDELTQYNRSTKEMAEAVAKRIEEELKPKTP